MNTENTNIDSIPSDIFIDIFSKLPTKLVGRCRCVSKLWASLLCRKDFTELFLTRSSNCPRLLFVSERKNGGWLFCSLTYPQTPSDKKSNYMATDYHSKIPTSTGKCSYASGLLCFRDVKRKGDHDSVSVICNPMTGRYKILPKLRVDEGSKTFLGFDPIDKKFKVFFITSKTAHILTLGTRELRWRVIYYFPFTHIPYGEGICINGVLYYLASKTDQDRPYLIVCFDVRSEKLIKFINAEYNSPELINCRGKLGMIDLSYICGFGRTCKICVWVLEDSEKHEWSEYVYESPLYRDVYHSVGGMTATGEFVLSNEYWRKPYCVLYFNPERNTLERVNIQWVGSGGNLEELQYDGKCYIIVDHVEDLSVEGSLI